MPTDHTAGPPFTDCWGRPLLNGHPYDSEMGLVDIININIRSLGPPLTPRDIWLAGIESLAWQDNPRPEARRNPDPFRRRHVLRLPDPVWGRDWRKLS